MHLQLLIFATGQEAVMDTVNPRDVKDKELRFNLLDKFEEFATKNTERKNIKPDKIHVFTFN